MGWGFNFSFPTIPTPSSLLPKWLPLSPLEPISNTVQIVSSAFNGDLTAVTDSIYRLRPDVLAKEINSMLPPELQFWQDADSRGTYIPVSKIVKSLNPDTGYYEFDMIVTTYSRTTKANFTIRITKDGYKVLSNSIPIKQPSVYAITFSREDCTALGSNLNYDSELGSDFVGTHQYRISYLDANGVETSGGEVSNAVIANGGMVKVIIPKPVDAAVDKVSLYRKSTLQGVPTAYLLVGTYPVTDFAGTPTTLTVYDRTRIEDLGKILPPDTIIEVPYDLLYITSLGGRLFGATKNYAISAYVYTPTLADPYPLGTFSVGEVVEYKVAASTFTLPDGNVLSLGDMVQFNGLTWDYRAEGYIYQDYDKYYSLIYSEIGQPNTWYGLNFINFEHSITGLGKSSNGLIVYSEFDINLIMNVNTENFSRRLVSNSHGCISHKSIQSWKGVSISASEEGIVITDGSTAKLASYDKLGIQSYRGQVLGSTVIGSSYFLLMINEGLIRYDLETNIFLKLDALDIIGIGKYRAELHLVAANRNMSRLEFNNPGSSNYSLTTGKLTEGAINNLKEYNKVRIYVEGYHSVTIFIGDKAVITNYMLKTGSTNIGIPNEFNKGYYIQFQINGTGKLHAIEYSVKGRDNG